MLSKYALQTADAQESLPAVIKNATESNALSIYQSTSVGNDRATSGALLISNTGNPHTGLTVHSDEAPGQNPLVRFEITDPQWDQEVLKIRSDSDSSRGLIRLDSPAPEIEFVETDQNAPAGKFEIRTQHNTFQINSRNAEDNSFENAFTFTPFLTGPRLGIGDRTPGASLDIVVRKNSPAFNISSSETASGDILSVSVDGTLTLSGGLVSRGPATFERGINIVGGCIALDGECITEELKQIIKNKEGSPSVKSSSEQEANNGSSESEENVTEPNNEGTTELISTPVSEQETSDSQEMNQNNATASETVSAKIEQALSFLSSQPDDISCNSYDERGQIAYVAKENMLFVCFGPERGWESTEFGG